MIVSSVSNHSIYYSQWGFSRAGQENERKQKDLGGQLKINEKKCSNTCCQFNLLSKTSIKIFQWSCKGIVMLHRGFCASDYKMHIPLSLKEMTPHQYEISMAKANNEREILTGKFILLN